METGCPKCGRPYGKRRRCYHCEAPNKRMGETCVCKQCGKSFYAARWQLADVERKQGTYCSRKCLYDSQRSSGPGYEYRRKDGYVSVYHPSHPDSTQSGMMLKHRLVAEEKVGRRLLATEHVHHINGIKDDNRPENLEVIDAGAHAVVSVAHGVKKRQALRDEVEHLRAEVAEYRKRYGPLE
jgi:hypothetical protein